MLITEKVEKIDGHKLQYELAEYLKRSIPYVAMEKSNARYDMVAYLPDYVDLGVPPSSKVELGCIHRYKRYFCRKKAEDNDYFRRPMYATDNVVIWGDIKAECKCPNDPACEAYQEYVKGRGENKRSLGPGLHIFEIKSDLDTHDRLTHQIPQMMYFADYVWLVLGDYQPVPIWLMPWIGIIRYAKGEWVIERAATGINNKPAMYWQVLTAYGLKDEDCKKAAKVLEHVHKLEQAWMINSVFHWTESYKESDHGHIVDMSRYLYWAHKMIGKIENVPKSEAKTYDEKKEEDNKNIQRTIEEFFDETIGGSKEDDTEDV